MNNDDIKQAIEAGNQTAIAEAFKFEQLEALIRKLIKEEGNESTIGIKAVLYCGNPFILIETSNIFDCWGTCGRQVWKDIYLRSVECNFIDKDTPDTACLCVKLYWYYKSHDGVRDGMYFADLFFFDLGGGHGEWQARMASGEVIALD